MSFINPITTKPLCREGFTGLIVCISENCSVHNPFICANASSEPCYKDHLDCRKQLLETFIERLINNKPKTQGLAQMELNVNKVLNTLSKMISQSKSAFQVWLREYYYSDDVKKIINSINDHRFASLTGNEMFYIYRQSHTKSKQPQYKFNKYYNKKAETILQYMRSVQEHIVSLYNDKINPKSINSIDISTSFASDITFDVGRRQGSNSDQINWKALQDQKEVNLQNKLKDSNQFRKFNRQDFSKTTVMRLSNNNITSLEWIRGLVFPSLHQMCLDYNMITDISPLEKIFFPILKGLHLQYNQIQDIRPLAHVHAPYLQILNLNYNQIEQIDILPHCKYQQLKRLYLHDNNINSIIPLLKMKEFQKLQLITIQANNLPYKSQEFRKLLVAIRSRFMRLNIRFEEGTSLI